MNHKQISVGQDNLSAVLDYFKSHLCATNVECAEALGLSVMAVGRHVKTIRASHTLAHQPVTAGLEREAKLLGALEMVQGYAEQMMHGASHVNMILTITRSALKSEGRK